MRESEGIQQSRPLLVQMGKYPGASQCSEATLKRSFRL